MQWRCHVERDSQLKMHLEPFVGPAAYGSPKGRLTALPQTFLLDLEEGTPGKGHKGKRGKQRAPTLLSEPSGVCD